MLCFECSSRREVLIAENHYDFEVTYKLRLYSDLSYQFSRNEAFHKDSIRSYSGTYLIKNDTLLFTGQLNDMFGDTVIIKNGFLEFMGRRDPFRLQIQKQDLVKMQMPDSSQSNNYAIFSYSPRFYKHIFPSASPYDLTNKDIQELDNILISCLNENREEITNKFSSYQRQYVAVINEHKEKEVWVNCGCKDIYGLEEFKYSLIKVHDGGDCFFRVIINLSKHNYSHLTVNGSA